MAVKDYMKVYKITCLVNGRYYIGRTKDYRGRVSGHKLELEKGTHYSKEMQDDYNKFGQDNFSWELLEDGLHKDAATVMEWKLILAGMESGDGLIYNQQLPKFKSMDRSLYEQLKPLLYRVGHKKLFY